MQPGDLVEVRRVKAGAEVVGDDWTPGVVGGDGTIVELQDPSDIVPGSRAGSVRAASLSAFRRGRAQIRRAPTRVPPAAHRPRPSALELDIVRSEAEGMVTEDAKVSATTGGRTVEPPPGPRSNADPIEHD